MGFDLISFSAGFLQKQAVQDILRCNERSEQYGLSLTPEQAKELVETRAASLQDNGLIEFGGGVIDKLINAFCDSPFLTKDNYAETLHGLIELFYYYKNESEDNISDADLIEFMKTAFNESCQGSLELLAGRDLFNLAKNLRNDHPADFAIEDIFDEDEYEEEEEEED